MLFVVSAELQAVLQWLSTSWSVCLSYITGTWQMVSCTTSADLHWVVGCHWPNLIANLITWSRRASTVWMQRSAARSLSYLVVCSCTVRPQQVSWSVLLHHPLFHPLFHPWFLAAKTFQVCPGSYSITLTICWYGLKACLWAEASATVRYLLWQIKKAQNVIRGTALVHCSLNLVEMDGSWRPPL